MYLMSPTLNYFNLTQLAMAYNDLANQLLNLTFSNHWTLYALTTKLKLSTAYLN